MDNIDLPNQQERNELVQIATQLDKVGLNQGTSGNLSIRCDQGFLITPSSIPFEDMSSSDIVALNYDGSPLLQQGVDKDTHRPSSEWRLHADLLSSRREINAVLHCHSTYATALACHRRGIPSFHYMVSAAGGDDIRCAEYETFGTRELSDVTLRALENRLACLLAHHGLVVIGQTLKECLRLAIEVETLAKMYLNACILGEPPRLSEEQMKAVHQQFAQLRYGQTSY